jgi:hypothetical protein
MSLKDEYHVMRLPNLNTLEISNLTPNFNQALHYHVLKPSQTPNETRLSRITPKLLTDHKKGIVNLPFLPKPQATPHDGNSTIPSG